MAVFAALPSQKPKCLTHSATSYYEASPPAGYFQASYVFSTIDLELGTQFANTACIVANAAINCTDASGVAHKLLGVGQTARQLKKQIRKLEA